MFIIYITHQFHHFINILIEFIDQCNVYCAIIHTRTLYYTHYIITHIITYFILLSIIIILLLPVRLHKIIIIHTFYITTHISHHHLNDAFHIHKICNILTMFSWSITMSVSRTRLPHVTTTNSQPCEITTLYLQLCELDIVKLQPINYDHVCHLWDHIYSLSIFIYNILQQHSYILLIPIS